MKCRECGKENVEKTEYCFYCGTKISESKNDQKTKKESVKKTTIEPAVVDNLNFMDNPPNGSKNKRVLIIAISAAAVIIISIIVLVLVIVKSSSAIQSDVAMTTVVPVETYDIQTEPESTEPITTELATTEPDLRVPNVVGMKSADAIEKINSAELRYKVKFDFSDSIPEDYVISQSPAEGKKINIGETIEIVISRGAEVIESYDSHSSSGNSSSSQSSSSSFETQGKDTADYYGLRVSSRYISRSDISWMSYDQIQFAINEVYAKLGYRFTKGNEKTYFESMDWYHPDTHDMYVIEARMNKYEYENIKVMGTYRDSLK